ncbi:MAG TPA: hypothetical protein VGL93_10925 [Streptosporangiaceae bacterium]
MNAQGRHTRRARRAEQRRQRCEDLRMIGAVLARGGFELPAGARLSRRDRRCLRAGYQEVMDGR